MKPARWIESVNCAIEGILWTARTQKHMRWHFLCAAVVLFAGLFFKVPTVDFLLLTLAITVVLFAEIINTAVEVVVDLVSPEYHPLARQAKDVAAGAVLLATSGAAVVGYVVFSSRIFAAVPGRERMIADVPGDVAVVSILIVTIAVILLKAHFALGSPLHGECRVAMLLSPLPSLSLLSFPGQAWLSTSAPLPWRPWSARAGS